MGNRGPKKTAGKREPNGRLSRKAEHERDRELAGIERDEWEAMYVALSARWRVHGVALKDARDQKAASWIGRLCIAGELTTAQYDAAQSYLEDRANNMAAISPAVPADVRAIDINAVRGRSNGENEARTMQSVSRWAAAQKAIAECQIEAGNTANMFAAIDLCVVRDVALPHMVGDLRSVLNALVRHYRLAARMAA